MGLALAGLPNGLDCKANQGILSHQNGFVATPKAMGFAPWDSRSCMYLYAQLDPCSSLDHGVRWD
jgi:hypothetical protein